MKSSSEIPGDESSRLYNWDELHFIPIKQKEDPAWAAEVLYFIKGDSELLFDPELLAERREIDKGTISSAHYKRLIDPEEGKAELFTSDWKANPLFMHLNNIIDSKIEKIPTNLLVKAQDEFSQLKLQKENAKILGRKQFLSFINDFNRELGFPELGENEDPFKYVKGMQSNGENNSTNGDTPTSLVDSLKAAISDNEDLALFNEYIWKDGVEIACELGIDHYLFNVNRWKDNSENTLSDIRLAAMCVNQYHVSSTTGRPVFAYKDPSKIYTSPFTKANLGDIYHWHEEEDVTFGEFVRGFGANLEKEDLQKIFEKNKMNGTNHGLDWDRCTKTKRSNARVRIGYCEFESQDKEVYASYVDYHGNLNWDHSDHHFNPKPVNKFKAKREERNYNVWRKFYYIPFAFTGDNMDFGTSDFKEQAKFIFDYGKIFEQDRYGDYNEYSRPSLFGWKSNKPSWFETMNAYMPKIHLLWQQVQNDIANIIPHGLVWWEEFLTAAAAGVDEKNQDIKEVKKNIAIRIKQSGSAISKMLDKNGNIIANGKPFAEVKTGHLEASIEKLGAIMMLYQMMTRALGISEVSEGVDPKQRQSLGGIQLAMEGTNNSTYFMEKAYSNLIVQCGTKMLHYLKTVVDQGESERLDEFRDVVGKANSMALESIKDIPLHRLGLSVQNVMTEEQKAKVNEMANQMAGAGMLEPDIALFITTIDNLKYSYAILRMYLKQAKKQKRDDQDAQNKFMMQMEQERRATEMAKIEFIEKSKADRVGMQGQIDERLIQIENQLRQMGQLQVKDKINDSRIEEKFVDDKLERDREQIAA